MSAIIIIVFFMYSYQLGDDFAVFGHWETRDQLPPKHP